MVSGTSFGSRRYLVPFHIEQQFETLDKYLHIPAIIKTRKEGGDNDGKNTQVDIGQT